MKVYAVMEMCDYYENGQLMESNTLREVCLTKEKAEEVARDLANKKLIETAIDDELHFYGEDDGYLYCNFGNAKENYNFYIVEKEVLE